MTFAYAPLLPGTPIAAAALAQLPGGYGRRCRPILSVRPGEADADALPDALAGLTRLEVLVDGGPGTHAGDALLDLVQRARARGADRIVPLLRVRTANASAAADALRAFPRNGAVGVGVRVTSAGGIGAAYELAAAVLAHRGHPPERAHVVLALSRTATPAAVAAGGPLAGSDQLASLTVLADAPPPEADRWLRPESALWAAARDACGPDVSLGDVWRGPPNGPPLYAAGRHLYRLDEAASARAIARGVVSAPFYAGPEFSRGDTILQMMSEGAEGDEPFLPLQAWVALLNHHLVATLHMLLDRDDSGPPPPEPRREARLDTYWAAGIRKVKIVACPDACAACSKQHGRVMSVRAAQRRAPLPCPGCTNEACRCVYLPVVPP